MIYRDDYPSDCRTTYSMFDAAHAALVVAAPDLVPGFAKTHRGLIGAFGRHVINPGLLPVELGRALNQVERIRLLADYTGEGIDEAKVRWAIDQAAAFFVGIETLWECQ